MAVIDKATFLPGCAGGEPTSGLGLVVGLERHSDTSPFVVVGQCACVQLQIPLEKLVKFNLPSPNWTATKEVVAQHFPAGCNGCGVWVRSTVEDCSKEHVEEVMEILCRRTDIQNIGRNNLLLVVATSTNADQSEQVECYACDCSDSISLQPVECQAESVEEYLSANTWLLRAQASLSFHMPTGHGAERDGMLSPLINQMLSASTVFHIPSHQLIFSESEPSKTTSLLHKRSSCDPLSVELLEDTSLDCTDPPSAPVLSCKMSSHQEVVELSIPIDVVGVFHLDTLLSSVATALKSAITTQLRTIGEETFWKDGGVCGVAKVHHFPLPTQHCPVAVVYPCIPQEREGEGELDQELLPLRLKLHHTFCLPNDRPFLRTINRHCFVRPQGPHLMNVHTAVKHSPVPGGTVSMVQGHYAYHHYMQDKFNDDGWGCAYRSLQTLWSWFVLQGYTQQPPPTHHKIQQALVEVGDKEPSFVGSTQWIGSFEVSATLNHLMGVLCKIHHCSSGSEMAGIGRVLLHHFNTQGTPVMIGGGVLAHTILGVDFNETTGEILFLILDPHYTGRDELKTVLDKGFCGWKPVTFWDQQAHYNLCMPLRPNKI